MKYPGLQQPSSLSLLSQSKGLTKAVEGLGRNADVSDLRFNGPYFIAQSSGPSKPLVESSNPARVISSPYICFCYSWLRYSSTNNHYVVWVIWDTGQFDWNGEYGINNVYLLRLLGFCIKGLNQNEWHIKSVNNIYIFSHIKYALIDIPKLQLYYEDR